MNEIITDISQLVGKYIVCTAYRRWPSVFDVINAPHFTDVVDTPEEARKKSDFEVDHMDDGGVAIYHVDNNLDIYKICAHPSHSPFNKREKTLQYKYYPKYYVNKEDTFSQIYSTDGKELGVIPKYLFYFDKECVINSITFVKDQMVFCDKYAVQISSGAKYFITTEKLSTLQIQTPNGVKDIFGFCPAETVEEYAKPIPLTKNIEQCGHIILTEQF